MYFLQNVRLHRGHHLQSLGFPEAGDDDGTESFEKLLESFDPWLRLTLGTYFAGFHVDVVRRPV